VAAICWNKKSREGTASGGKKSGAPSGTRSDEVSSADGSMPCLPFLKKPTRPSLKAAVRRIFSFYHSERCTADGKEAVPEEGTGPCISFNSTTNLL
jgi:hypothetical protein